MQRLRKIVFYLLCVSYLIFCPLLILYAFGFIFRPSSSQVVIETGLIYLATLPQGAEITVNGEEQKQTTPAAVRNLVERDYSVKITLEGYREWDRKLPVEKEKATVLDKILLLPDTWKQYPFFEDDTRPMIYVAETDVFMISEGNTAGDVLVCDYKTKKAWPLLKKESPFYGAAVISYFSVKGSATVILKVQIEKEIKIVWARLENKNNTIKEITDLFRSTPLLIAWAPGQSDMLYSLEQNNIDRIDTGKRAVYPDLIKGVKGFTLYNGNVYAVKQDNSFVSVGNDADDITEILGKDALSSELFGRSTGFEVKCFADDLFILIGNEGQLISNKLPYYFVDKGVKGVEFAPETKKLLIWTKNKIGILYFSEEKTGKVPFELGPKLVWIYEKGQNIDQAFWVYEGSHVLFRDKDQMSLIELEGYDMFVVNEIGKVAEKDPIYYSEETGELYFVDTKDSTLKYVEIVPDTSFLPKYRARINKQKKKNKIEESWTSDFPGTD